MGGCNCKSNPNVSADSLMKTGGDSTENLGQRIGKYSLKVFGFILLLVSLPIINLFIIWFMFKTLVLNKDIDMKPLLLAIGNKFKEKDDEEDENENLTENDVEMLDVEVLRDTNK